MEQSERDRYRQYAEQAERDEQLVRENRKLREEIRGLYAHIATLEGIIERLKGVEALCKRQEERIEQLESGNERKDTEIQRLKAQIDKNSSNSSKPPSSDGLKKVVNSRQPSERKRGGQAGHKGKKASIPGNLDELVKAGKAEHIVRDMTNGAKKYVSDWIIEAKVMPVYIEVRRPAGTLPRIRYGEAIKSMAVYLQNVGLMSLGRISEFVSAATEGLIKLSCSAIVGFTREAAANVNLDEYVNDLLNGKVIHVDETPVRTTERKNREGDAETPNGSTLNAYIRTYSNEKTTVLMASAHKDDESVKADGILTRFCGIVSQDHEAKFYNYGDQHATCGAHLLRDLKGLEQLYKFEWAADAAKLLTEMNDYKNEDVDKGADKCAGEALAKYEERYDELVRQGRVLLNAAAPRSFGRDELRRMVERLERYKNCYLLFMRDYAAPFTNNQAERDLRHCKVKQKIAGCFRSWQGQLDYCKIRSLTDTAHKRHENPLHAIQTCFLSTGAG
jgi:transposase